ncbi:S1C family serine protease [Marininema halotolerans]|uniref:Serine protease Do n=1 Tax=Marininema halotolerans TaxID=1155944 RepID=A0A1I6P9D5_9BACL|nr:trypsin-like peptidase domain-containing protein [Marininema halotolerans]SFS36750.1 serine protease Do [Marininema halotolerans]
MGYYNNQKGSSSPLRLFFVALISAIIGGLLVLALSPALSRSGILPQPSAQGPVLSEETGPENSISVHTNITSAVQKVRSAVVGVVNLQKSGNSFDQKPVEQGTGSGVIFKKEGDKALVVTNHHVVAGADQVSVVIPGKDQGKEVNAKVIGEDEPTDLAVLEMPSKYVKSVAKFGNSDNLKAGEPAIAIGNPLGLEFSQSVTAGVISSPHRQIQVSETMVMDAIQTDAAINPGNSGGALINSAGQVIGINSLKIAEQGVEGLGFAIPVNDAKPTINDLIQYGEVKRPFLGIQLRDLDTITANDRHQLNLPDSVQNGVVVIKVTGGSSADQAKLKRLDVITELDGKPIKNGSALRSYLWKDKNVGDTMTITYYRDGKKQTTKVKLQAAS